MTTQLSTTAVSGSQSTYQPSQSDSDDLSSVRQDLTTLFDESNLSGVHFLRTTQTGFRLDNRRLSQLLPTSPSKLTRDS
jgi:hypothetical protein